jgi:hypothetical protein
LGAGDGALPGFQNIQSAPATINTSSPIAQRTAGVMEFSYRAMAQDSTLRESSRRKSVASSRSVVPMNRAVEPGSCSMWRPSYATRWQ